MPVIPALRRLRQEVKASLGHSENLSQKNKKKRLDQKELT
jgi:hypothetical protein